MPEKNRVFTPDRTYEVEVKIKELDYTNDTIRVIVDSSLSTAYQVVTIVMEIDPNDVIIEEVFGGEPIKLNITLLREQQYQGPRLDIELMYVSSHFKLTEKNKTTKKLQKDRTALTIVTVVRSAYTTMNSLVNRVFIGANLSTIISGLASDVGATVEYEAEGQNTDVIEQVCVPPITLYNAIKEHTRNDPNVFDGYLDQRFGLFDGVPGVFCQYNNKVYIKNLTSKLKKDQTFTVYQLASGEDKKITDKIYNDALNGDVFYTYNTIDTDYAGNAKFAKLAPTLKHIVRPNNTLTHTITQDLQTVAKDYSLVYLNQSTTPNFNMDSAVNRIRYYNEDTGFNTDETIFNSRFARTMADLSTVSLDLERNLPVLNLIEVGECVKFKPLTVEYQDLQGKYLLWSSRIVFTKPSNWETTCRVNLVRTNKKN